MKSFWQSNATRAVLIYLALQILIDLQPMLSSHEIDGWALVHSLVGAGIVLLGNALRTDIRTGIKALDAGNREP